MKKNFYQLCKAIAVILIFVMEFGSISANLTKADLDTEVPKDDLLLIHPVIGAEVVNETDVLVTIDPINYKIDSYEIWIDSDIGYEAYKVENRDRIYCYNADLTSINLYGDENGDYYLADICEADGFKTTTVTIKNVPKGEAFVKVRACVGDKKSGTSEPQRVEITSGKNGYKEKYNFSKVKVGETIKFGAYEKDFPADGRDPIEWVVLQKTKDLIMVISKYALDCLPYNIESKDVTWETCTLRKWLNEEFYEAAFNSKEKKLIMTAGLLNATYSAAGCYGGNNTKDKVFLLAESDLLNPALGFDTFRSYDDKNRRCAPTDYAIAQGLANVIQTDVLTKDNKCTVDWWLRTPGKDNSMAIEVQSEGFIPLGGIEVNSGEVGVRPVIGIRIEKNKKTKKKK